MRNSEWQIAWRLSIKYWIQNMRAKFKFEKTSRLSNRRATFTDVNMVVTRGLCSVTRVASSIAALVLLSTCGSPANAELRQDSAASPNVVNLSRADPTVELTDNQLKSIKIEPVGTHVFALWKTGIGTIDFDNNLYSDASLSRQVFPPQEGKITKIFSELGDEVRKDAPLYTINVPGPVPKEVTVRSPIAGQITSINATPGLMVEPTGAPAPCAVADVTRKWLLANVPESDVSDIHTGQKVEVKVAEFSGRTFQGTVSKIFPTVDMVTHRASVRATIFDPVNSLRSGMLADFSVRVRGPIRSSSLPENGLVREGDGTITAWVTKDKKHFTQRTVQPGLSENGQTQILSGLHPGELAVTDGTVFLDNMLNATPSD